MKSIQVKAQKEATRVLGYQVARQLTVNEIKQVAGGACEAGQSVTWSNGSSCGCSYQDDCGK